MEIVSSLPGRIRFRNQVLQNNKVLSKYMNVFLENLQGIKRCEINSTTGSILLIYDEDKINIDLLESKIENALESSENKQIQMHGRYEEYFKILENRDKARQSFLVWAIVYIALKIKSASQGKFSISRSVKVLQVASLVTIVGGYPLLKRYYKKFTQRIPTDSDLLLKLTAASFTLIRESSKGIFVLMLKSLNDYIKYSTEAECQRILNQTFEKTAAREVTCDCNSFKKIDTSLKGLNIFAKVERYQQRIAPIAIGTAALNYFITGSMLNALSIILVLSPSASNVALTAGIKNYAALLSKHKIYLKNPKVIEKIINTDHFIFDKTGVLTYGNMNIEKIDILDSEYNEAELLKICAACEAGNYHPISRTLQEKAGPDINISSVKSSILIPSKGVEAVYDNHDILIGNSKFLEEKHVDISRGLAKYSEYENRLVTPIMVSIDQRLTAIVALEEVLRKDAEALIKKLRFRGDIRLSIVTGDKEEKALFIGNRLGIESIYSGCSSIEKVNVVEDNKRYNTVTMIGDGINDSAAMSAADVSVGLAKSSCDEIKLHSDCIILEDAIIKLADMYNLTEKSYRKINQHIAFTQLYNLTFGVLAFFSYFDAFTAKSLNTINTLLVLLLNERIRITPPVNQISNSQLNIKTP